MPILPTLSQFIAAVDKQAVWLGKPDIEWQKYDEHVFVLVNEILSDPMAAQDAAVVTEILAEDLLISMLGKSWLDSLTKIPERSDDLIVKVRRLQLLSERRELARRLYQFQSYPWFEHYLRHVEKNDPQSSLFEGDVIRHLMNIPGSDVSRVAESGRKGEDYDILLRYPSGTLIPVEVKTKDSSTPFTTNTVKSTLKAAARQLPVGSLGLVFLRAPFSWVGGRLELEYPEAIHEGIRQTTRIAAVFTAIDKSHIDSSGTRGSVTRIWHPYFSESNDNSMRERLVQLLRILEAGDRSLFAPRPPF